MAKSKRLKWADEPSGHDYPAAASYLSLIAPPTLADVLSSLLAHPGTVEHPVKDILRAARLPLLPADDPEVAKDLKKVAKGIPLSPVLLIRGDIESGRPLQIADGYHRVCASYHHGENAVVPCRLVDPPAITV